MFDCIEEVKNGKTITIYFDCGYECKCIRGKFIEYYEDSDIGIPAIKIDNNNGKVFSIACDRIVYWTYN